MARHLSAGLLLILISVQAGAERVITLAPHLTELVCAAGACDQLVGVVKHSDYPDSVRALPQVGDAHAINIEQLLSLDPDLILSWEDGTPAQTVARLSGLGLRVEAIRVRDMRDIGLAILRVGALLGSEDASCKAEASFRANIEALRRRYADAKPIKVMYQLEPDPVYTVNSSSPISAAFALCGAQNVFADYARLAGPVSREAVIAADPDVIVFGEHDDVAGILRGWGNFPNMRAQRFGNLIAINADKLARATPRMAEGTAELCLALDAARQRLGKHSP